MNNRLGSNVDTKGWVGGFLKNFSFAVVLIIIPKVVWSLNTGVSAAIMVVCAGLFALFAVYFIHKAIGQIARFIDSKSSLLLKRKGYLTRLLVLSIPFGFLQWFYTQALMEHPSNVGDYYIFQMIICAIVGVITIFWKIHRAHDMGWTSKAPIWSLIFAIGPLFGFAFPSLGAAILFLGWIPNLILECLYLFHGSATSNNEKDVELARLKSELNSLKS